MKILLLLLLSITSTACHNVRSPVLITPDYGILNAADIKAYEINRNIAPFNPKNRRGLAYWQCFRKPKIQVQGEPLGYIEEWASMGCDITIHVETKDKKKYIYGMRRGLPVEYFKEKKVLWEKISQNQEYVCLGGEHRIDEKSIVNGHKITTSYWTFDKIKTKIGRDSYFEE